MEEKVIHNVICKNCGTQFSGKFCNHCAQSADTKRINHAYIFVELKKTFIQYNSGFFYTLKELFLNPGNFLASYLQGKRVDYSKPFAFLIIVCGLNVLLYHYLKVDIVLNDVEGFGKEESNDFIFEYYVQIQLLILPVYALVSILFFKQKIYNFYEFIVIHTYLAGQRILLNLLIIALEAYIADPAKIKIIMHAGMIIIYSIMIWTYVNLFKEQSKIKVILKTIAVEVITFIVVLLTAALFVLSIQ